MDARSSYQPRSTEDPARLLSGLTDDAEPHTPVVITKEEAVPLVGLTSDERQADLGAEGANTDPRYGLRQRRALASVIE